MLENAFKCMKGHACENEDLRLSVLDRKGLCITIKIKCMNCGFNSVDVPLFQSVKRHGRSTGVINDCLLLPVLSSKLGISDLQRVLACLNIQSPDKRGMQRKFNTLSDEVVKMNNTQMQKKTGVCAKSVFVEALKSSLKLELFCEF